jgi:hypothetical protein
MNKSILSIALLLSAVMLSACGGGEDALPPEVVATPTPSVSPSTSPSPVPPYNVQDLFTASSAVHAQVDQYVKGFIDTGAVVGKDIVKMLKTGAKLKIQIGSLDQYGAGVIGLCETAGGSRTVTLDPDFFNQSQDPVQNQLLVSHELGHCVLFRPHTSSVGVLPDGSGHSHELSIMYPIIIGSQQYDFHKPYYDDELYNDLDVSMEPHVYICP